MNRPSILTQKNPFGAMILIFEIQVFLLGSYLQTNHARRYTSLTIFHLNYRTS